MFIDRPDPPFAVISAHKKQGGTSEAEIKAFKKRNGYINLDNPEHKKRYQNQTGPNPMSGYRLPQCVKTRKAAVEKAEAEHLAALLRLKDGTAVHRQPNDRAPLAKPVKKEKRIAKRKTGTRVKSPDSFDKYKAMVRRKEIMTTLMAGGRVEYVSQKECKGGYIEYQRQYTDIRWIIRTQGLSIVRMQSVKTGQSYFVLDNFVSYQALSPISGYLEDINDRAKLLAALTSHQLVQVGDIASTTKIASRSISVLAGQHGLDAYTIFEGRNTAGWIVIDGQ